MRRLSVLVGALVAFALVATPVSAQDATPAPATPFAALGLPEVTIRGTATGYEVPAEVASGRTLVTFENVDAEDANSFVLLKVEGDVNLGDLPSPSATPEAEGEDLPIPAWFYTATWIGSSLALPGGRSQIVADLTPGQWVVLNYSAITRPSQPFTVTGEAAPSPAEPAAAVTVTEQDYAFVGLEGPLPTGPQVWRVTNRGPEPHEMALIRAPKALTQQQWMTLFSMPEGATPPPDFGVTVADLEQLGFPDGVAALSAGQTVWTVIDLPPGEYVAVCFLSSPDGMSHALMGMIQPFSVG